MSSETRAERAAFLGVEQSLTGRRWAERLADERIALAMAQRHGLPDAICRLLAAREVPLDDVPDFLEPTLRKLLPDPSHLKDMDVAVARLVRAVQAGERCCCASSAASVPMSDSTFPTAARKAMAPIRRRC
jgi:single-stranded-DNA-specific exonuclease